ncbi:uncharacterized protein LOC135826656 [Sycon ciliatum]|uniref:uncharacterized protein LOC135826656 n=1 Tax=Sycon ciliatum TaxID=27933 RepID=UPI0031F6BB91
MAISLASGQQPVDDQQPQFHPGPPNHWMNDPNGPMYYKGYYHLFFQYNPLGPSWGHMSWGHIVSKGSATIRDDGTPIIVYTCVGHGQLQCIALPNDTSDPTLVAWHKPPQNPVISKAPPGGTTGQFRDDTTAWKGTDGSWRMVVGASINGTGSASLWKTTDFYNWTFAGVLSDASKETLELCPDFFNAINDPKGRWILKYSAGGDWYRIGSYDAEHDKFAPETAPARYDYGQFYASKRFYDPVKKRQILYGWSSEEDKDAAKRGWQGHQTLPRSLVIDEELDQLLLNPVEELELLRKSHTGITTIKEIAPGVQLLPNVKGLQLEIILVVKIPTGRTSVGVAVRASEDLKTMTSILVGEENLHGPLNNTDLPGDDFKNFNYPMGSADETNMENCSAACDALKECVAWTYVRAGDPHNPRCALKNVLPNVVPRSCCISGTKNNSAVSSLMVNRTMTGGTGNLGLRSGPLPMKPSDKELTLRVFVDHSMVEAIAQSGRSCVTAHVYPDASNDMVGLVNFGDGPVEVVSLDVYEMDSCWVQ